MKDDMKPGAEDSRAPEWEYRKNFAINDRMKEIVKLTIDTAQSEITRLRRKLDKLTYGS